MYFEKKTKFDYLYYLGRLYRGIILVRHPICIKYAYTYICFIFYILNTKNVHNYERSNNMIYDRLKLAIILHHTITYLAIQQILSIELGL